MRLEQRSEKLEGREVLDTMLITRIELWGMDEEEPRAVTVLEDGKWRWLDMPTRGRTRSPGAATCHV